MIRYTHATTDDELRQILALQTLNQTRNTPADYQREQGFVTVTHALPQLQAFCRVAPQIIAKQDDTVIGYALTMPPALRNGAPELISLFDEIDKLTYADKPLAEYRYYVMGQVCVAEAQRGLGVFDGLYATHRAYFQADYDLCVTDIATRNTRSMRAHARVGFRVIHEFADSLDHWAVVVWDFSKE
jgi:hypothetical protein